MSAIFLINVIVCDAFALAFLAVSAWKGAIRRYLFLNLYTAGLLLASAVRLSVVGAYGFRSTQYFYTFYVSDLILTVLMYMVILSVFEIILSDTALRNQARMAFLVCFAIVAMMSYMVITSTTSIYGRYIIELQQNMYFASVVMTVLLCISLAHFRVVDPQLRTLVFGLGAYAGIQATSYALQNIMPKTAFDASWKIIGSMLLPFATELRLAIWCAALVRVPVLAQLPSRGDGVVNVPTSTVEVQA